MHRLYVLLLLAAAVCVGCRVRDFFGAKPTAAPGMVGQTTPPADNVIPYGAKMTASARHILVPSENECQDLRSQIEGGADFAMLARLHSKCPSGRNGGDLGEFGRGQMAPEFDRVCFNEPVHKLHGPVKTQFGYHLIEITDRQVK
jgi:peptidyl-prolyl cis-trans isomerase C